jgi:hypothetical protein
MCKVDMGPRWCDLGAIYVLCPAYFPRRVRQLQECSSPACQVRCRLRSAAVNMHYRTPLATV